MPTNGMPLPLLIMYMLDGGRPCPGCTCGRAQLAENRQTDSVMHGGGLALSTSMTSVGQMQPPGIISEQMHDGRQGDIYAMFGLDHIGSGRDHDLDKRPGAMHSTDHAGHRLVTA